MNIIDFVIIVLILLGGFIGLKKGFTLQLVSFVGFILALVLAFYLKNPVSEFFYQHLPFFQFDGIFKGITVLNIAVYELLAFLVVLAALTLLLKILVFATSIFEKFLTMTIILGIPSKILGMILGIIEWSLISFVAVYILCLPFFDFTVVRESNYAKNILPNVPVLSNAIDQGLQVIDEFADLKEKYRTETNPNQFNLETLALFLKYKVVDRKAVDQLVKSGKIKIDGIDSVLNPQ